MADEAQLVGGDGAEAGDVDQRQPRDAASLIEEPAIALAEPAAERLRGAAGTSQFRWVRSRLPREAQPVPPIFQPEVAADAIL